MEMKKVLQLEGRDAKNIMAYNLSNMDAFNATSKFINIIFNPFLTFLIKYK